MRKIVIHILLSAGLLILLVSAYYYYIGTPREKGPWITMLGFPVFIGCIYIGRGLAGTWFFGSKKIWYLLYFIPWLAVVLVLHYLLARFLLDMPDLGFTELSIGFGPLFILGLIAGFLVKLIREYTKKQLKEAQVIAAQKENELHQLHAQLSPHFLFNTLNNMYGIAIAEHKRIPGLLLKLSELLRYSLYETGQTFVPLKDELAYIRNYIEFEKMRISDRLALTERIEEAADGTLRIAPMLLIIFIENAFKHSKNTLEQKIRIDISLKVNTDAILFSISNSYNAEMCSNGRSGLGLANAAKRLDLLYGENYHLHSFAEDNIYRVELELKAM